MSLFYSAGLGGSAIPDSEANQKLAHRWVLDDVGTGTVVDSVGTADGSVNGPVSVSGDYAGGSAGQGDGVDDYIETTPWGDFGSNMGSDFAVAFTISNITTNNWAFYLNHDSGAQSVGAGTDSAFNSTAGRLNFIIRSDGDAANWAGVETPTAVDDGGTYRVVCNKTGNTESDLEIWLNQSQTNVNLLGRDQFDSTSVVNFTNNVPLFSQYYDGAFQGHFGGIIDDFCVFNNSLTQTEIESYQNPWQ